MLKDRTSLCISCSICPTIYVNKHLSRLTYGRAPAKGSNPVVTRNRRIGIKLDAENDNLEKKVTTKKWLSFYRKKINYLLEINQTLKKITW